MSVPAEVQHAALTLRAGPRTALSAEVSVTPRGLLAIGGLVAAILVSTALIVRVARRPGPALTDRLPPPG